jgi:hypothetical protein
MSARVHGFLRWLRTDGSGPLLVAIIVLTGISVAFINDEGAARPVTHRLHGAPRGFPGPWMPLRVPVCGHLAG